MNSEVNSVPDQLSNVRTTSRSKFIHLIERLMSYLSPNDSHDANAQKGICENFDKLQQFIETDFSINKSDGLDVNNNARIIYLHMLYLRNKCKPEDQLPQKIAAVLGALQQITKLSHDQYYGPRRALDNRRLQISLGLVEVLAELFTLDVDIFGLQLTSYNKCSKFRRSVANALMNLVYQQRDAKFRLCKNNQFLRRVADVINHIYPLVQFYAGLIQNLSYNADKTISHHLAIIVPPLVHAAVNISFKECEGKKYFDPLVLSSQRKQQLLKILSALWNLAEDPVENKRVMCFDFPEFVPLLLLIMCFDQNELHLIKAATGILKHLSGYFLQFPELFSKIMRRGATSSFMRQLTSSSADLVIDSLSALYTLSVNPIVARELLSSESYLQQIGYLTRNTNEEISRASRLVLNNVYSASAYFTFQPEKHSTVAFPIEPNLITTPSMSCSSAHPLSRRNFLNTKQNEALKLLNQDKPEKQDVRDEGIICLEDPLVDPEGQDLPTSVMCTRNASSRSSFNSADVKVNEWSSTSARSSVNQSPASATDLPDSPSQCSSHKVFQLKEMELQILKALDENKHSGHCTNADISGNSDVNAGEVLKNSCDGSCLLQEMSSGGILAEAIRDFMPKPIEHNGALHVGITRSSTPVLTPISCNSPCKAMSSESSGPKHKRYTQLLEDSIASVMPSKHRSSFQVQSRDTSSSRTSKNTNTLHNNSEEDFNFGLHESSSIDLIKSGKNELIVVDCLEFSSTDHPQPLYQTPSSIPLLSTRVKQRQSNGNVNCNNQQVISFISDDNILSSPSKSNDQLKTRNSD